MRVEVELGGGSTFVPLEAEWWWEQFAVSRLEDHLKVHNLRPCALEGVEAFGGVGSLTTVGVGLTSGLTQFLYFGQGQFLLQMFEARNLFGSQSLRLSSNRANSKRTALSRDGEALLVGHKA